MKTKSVHIFAGLALGLAALAAPVWLLGASPLPLIAFSLAFAVLAILLLEPVKLRVGDNLGRLVLAVFVCAFLVAFGHYVDPVAGVAMAPFMLGEIKMDEIREAIEKASKSVKETTDRMQQALDQAINDVKKLETVTGKSNDELKAANEAAKKTQDNLKSVMDRVLEVEQKIAKKHGGNDTPRLLSPGRQVIASEQFKAASEKAKKGAGKYEMDAVEVGSFRKTSILTSNVQTTGTVDILGEEQDVGLVAPVQRQLIVRNLIPVYQTESNLIEFATENVFTNNAGIQGQNSSPSGDRDGQLKNESAITFALTQVPVVTVAHWIPASRQVLADAKMLAAYIDQRLRYGILFKEEDEVLNGAAVEGDINGIINQATQYNRAATSDNMLDTLLKAFLQVTLSEFVADGAVMSWVDWTNLLLQKDTQGRYLFGNPAAPVQTPQCWGRPVVPTNSIASPRFVVGAFQLATALWDREQNSVRVAEQHSDFFVRNMVAILAEERIALTVYRPTAIVKGNFFAQGQPGN